MIFSLPFPLPILKGIAHYHASRSYYSNVLTGATAAV